MDSLALTFRAAAGWLETAHPMVQNCLYLRDPEAGDGNRRTGTPVHFWIPVMSVAARLKHEGDVLC
jgi:hypothetical protein